MIRACGKNWEVLHKQENGIKRLINSFDPDDKKFGLLGKAVSADAIAQILNS
jgi:hypothetical protein